MEDSTDDSFACTRAPFLACMYNAAHRQGVAYTTILTSIGGDGVTMDAAAVVTMVVVAATLALMLTRPRDISEAWFAAIGASLLVLTHVLPWNAPFTAFSGTADVLIFLAGMMLVTGVVERAGVIEIVAERIARVCGSNIHTLYIAMFILAALVTATMSLDITIILVTPILFAITRRRGIDPIPFLFACAFVANIGSLILPVSNLTNLLLVNRLDLAFAGFVRVMWLPNTVALLTTLAMFLWLFRNQLRMSGTATHTSEPAFVPGVASGPWRRWVGFVLVVVILGLLVAGFAEQPIWIPAVIGAVVLVGSSAITRRITIAHVIHDLSLSLFVFVVAMTMLVQAINTHVLCDFALPVPDSLAAQIGSGVVLAGLASNVINNVPATVIAGELLDSLPSGPREVMAYAALVGANIGPALTTYGSLATMLWLSLIRKRGTNIPTAHYMRVSLLTVPVVLITTSVSLWIALAWF